MARRRLTIQEAAQELGTTVDALRSRVRRGTLDSEKGEDGRVFVWLGTDQATDQAPPSQGESKAQVEGSELTEDLREQIAYLREQLEAERKARAEESRELRRLLAGLIERVPQLEPPQEPQEPQTGTESEDRIDNPEAPSRPGEDDSEGHGRPWWRRWFGG